MNIIAITIALIVGLYFGVVIMEGKMMKEVQQIVRNPSSGYSTFLDESRHRIQTLADEASDGSPWHRMRIQLRLLLEFERRRIYVSSGMSRRQALHRIIHGTPGGTVNDQKETA